MHFIPSRIFPHQLRRSLAAPRRSTSFICRSDSADRWLASFCHTSLIQTELSSRGSFAMMYFRHPGTFLEPFNNMSAKASRLPGNATILVFSENICGTSTLLRRIRAFGCDSVGDVVAHE